MRSRTTRHVMTSLLTTLLFGVAGLGVVRADGVFDGAKPVFNQEKPTQLKGVGVEEHLDEKLPLDVKFRNQNGQVVQLGDLFRGDIPVILSLNYSSCPMLCSTQLTGLTNSLRKLEWSAGTQFRVVSMSFDPNETPRQAKKQWKKYVDLYGRGPAGWSFLVGPRTSIDAVTEAVGFHYKYLPERDEYAHPAVAILCTPDGRIARYLYNVRFPEQTMRLSLVEASEGKIGGAGAQLLLFCFHYNPETGSYAPRLARLAMSVAACVTVLTLVAGVFMLRRREPSYAAAGDEGEADSDSSSRVGD